MAVNKRLLITLSAKANEVLEGMQRELGESSKAEVVRNAISLYSTAFRKALEGYELCMKRGDELRVIDTPGLFPEVPWPDTEKKKKPAKPLVATET